MPALAHLPGPELEPELEPVLEPAQVQGQSVWARALALLEQAPHPSSLGLSDWESGTCRPLGADKLEIATSARPDVLSVYSLDRFATAPDRLALAFPCRPAIDIVSSCFRQRKGNRESHST